MGRILSDDCLSLARLVANGARCSDITTDDGREPEAVMKAIAIELLLLEASYEEKSYVIADVRETHCNAYKPWSRQEEKLLMDSLISGHSVAEICNLLGRQPGGIISRIRKIREQNLAA